jgi:hypothetical protein
VGLTQIPPTRFRGVIRFLEAIADGQDADLRDRPPTLSLSRFIRCCADDIKALYYEARLVTVPDATGAELAVWFWGETAAGQLLRRVRDRLAVAEDPDLRAVAVGIG